MKGRPCSRRFLATAGRRRSLLDSSRISADSGVDSNDSGENARPPASDGRRPIRKTYRIAAGTIVTVALLVVGFFAAGDPANPSSPGGRFTAPTLDHFLSWDSFSEVEQTKSVLQALCLQSIALIRRDYLRSRPVTSPASPHSATATATTTPSPLGPDPALLTAISRVRQRIEEFGGTTESVILQGELLRLYRRAGADNEWLDLYLEVVYRHPNQALITMESSRAIELGGTMGRGAEVRDALNHWSQIPPRYRPQVFGNETEPPGRGPR